MTSILQTLKKPYDYAMKLCTASRTHRGVSPSLIEEKSSVLNSILSPFETYVVSLQSLLIWEQPYLSAGAFVTLNILYWLIVSWNRRFFSIISIFSLALFVYKTWVNRIWPEIRVPPAEGEDTESWCTLNPGVLSVPELCRYLNDFLDKMIILWKDVWKLRKENHGLFCSLMCGFFSITAVIGIIFPGVLLVYFIVLLLTLGPGVALHLIPATVYDQIIGYFSETDSQVSPVSKSTGNSDHDSDLEEFVPEVSPEIIRQLSLREDVPEIPSPGVVLSETLITEHLGNESDDFSLYQGLGSFPSVEEEGESEEEISDNIIPQAIPEKIEMHFNPLHFKEDSSDSEGEAAFTEGLSFSETREAEPSINKPSTTTLQTDGTTQAESDVKVRKVSSDLEDELSDFELLEDSDIPKIN